MEGMWCERSGNGWEQPGLYSFGILCFRHVAPRVSERREFTRIVTRTYSGVPHMSRFNSLFKKSFAETVTASIFMAAARSLKGTK